MGCFCTPQPEVGQQASLLGNGILQNPYFRSRILAYSHMSHTGMSQTSETEIAVPLSMPNHA